MPSNWKITFLYVKSVVSLKPVSSSEKLAASCALIEKSLEFDKQKRGHETDFIPSVNAMVTLPS